MEKNKQKNSAKIGVRDIVTIAICYVLIFVVFFIGGSIGFYPKAYIFSWALCSIFWGTIFLLMYTKVNKKGVPITFSIVLSLVMFNYHWILPLCIMIGGIISEIIWQKMDRKSTKTMGIVFTIQISSWQIAATLPLFFILDNFKAKNPDYAELFDSIVSVISPTLEIISIILTIICCFIGILIGKKVLKKHFEKAGII